MRLESGAGNEQGNGDKGSTNIRKRFWEALNSSHNVNRLLMVFTGALVIVGIQQCAYIGRANKVARQAAGAAEQAAEAATISANVAGQTLQVTQRAIISVTPSTPPDLLISGKTMTWRVTNEGQTEATHIHFANSGMITSALMSDSDLEKGLVPNIDEPSNSFLAPKESAVLHTTTDFTARLEELKSGTPVILYGQAIYDDVFGHGHFIRFCTYIRFDGQLHLVRSSTCPFWSDIK